MLDEGSFIELDEFARHRSSTFGMDANRPLGDGVVTGYGTVDGRPVCVFSQDVTVFGGSLGEVYGEKIVKVLDFAMKNGCPVVGINEGGGARIQEGVVSLGLYGEIFYRNVLASGVVPQISLVMGAAAGGHVYSPALTDFVVMVDKTSQMFITGPDVVRTVTGEDVTLEELGGARTHNTLSGVAHYLGADEDDALNYVKALLSYLPSNNLDPVPVFDVEVSDEIDSDDAFLDTFIPDSPNQPYDMHRIIEHLLDDAEFLEVHALFAPNIVVGFGRIEGHPVGIVANQPLHFAGTLDIDASEKAARFVRTCDAFNVPVITLVDVPGFLPGVGQEHAGIIRRGAKLIYAYAEATVPKITIVTRKAFGGAYVVMGSKHLGADVNVAWPTAQVAVMGAQGAVNILYRRDIAAADDPEAMRAKVVGRLRRHPGQPLHGGRARLRRRRDPALTHPLLRHQMPADAAQQTRDTATQETRQHPAMTDVQILRGDPEPEELAALTAIIAATASGDAIEPRPSTIRGRWNDPANALRRSRLVGPGGWRAGR